MRVATNERVAWVNELLNQFGVMTLRQIYYQLVTKGLNYRQVGYICKVGRVKGLIPWKSIVDRNRPVYSIGRTFVDVDDFLQEVVGYFNLDYWADSENHIELWTEKDALSQVLYRIAEKYHVTVRVTRGFLSLSNKVRWGSDDLTILYFGDFDPSGLFMDKDLQWSQLGFKNFHRIALTQEQIRDHKLPSVKVNKRDPRAASYIANYGMEGWELDALPPNILETLVANTILKYTNFVLEQKQLEQDQLREQIRSLI